MPDNCREKINAGYSPARGYSICRLKPVGNSFMGGPLTYGECGKPCPAAKNDNRVEHAA